MAKWTFEPGHTAAEFLRKTHDGNLGAWALQESSWHD